MLLIEQLMTSASRSETMATQPTINRAAAQTATTHAGDLEAGDVCYRPSKDRLYQVVNVGGICGSTNPAYPVKVVNLSNGRMNGLEATDEVIPVTATIEYSY
jgi:hypothetical protein